MFRVVISSVLLAAAAAGQTVEGTAINTVTNQPVAGVKVAIQNKGKTAGEAVTDGQGGFRIEGLPPGEYTADVSKRGFQVPREAASRRAFRVTAAGPVRLDVRLTPMGRIGGRVVDGEGAPVAGAGVQLLGGSIGYSETTDKEGRFFSAEVAPGAYLISAEPPKSLKAPPAKGDTAMGWAATFYPGVTAASAASKVEMRAGGEVWDLEIRLQAVAVHRVRGTVLDDRGEPAAKVQVTLGNNRPVFSRPGERERQTISEDDGSFEFAAVSDGAWPLKAERDKDGVKLRAFTAVSVAGHDLERVALRLSAPFRIEGTVAREGPAGMQAKSAPMLVLLTPESGGDLFHQGIVDAAGRFTMEGVYPGRYVVRPIPPGAPYYLSSIRVGDREVPLLGLVELTSGALPVTVVYKADGGGVRGKVENCGAASVMFFPQDAALQIPELERRATCGEGGSFEIGAMRPGEYYGFAFEQAPGLEAMFFGFQLEQGLINQAMRVTVRAGEVTAVDLKVTAR